MAAAFLAPLIPTQKRSSLALMLAALVAAAARPILNVNAPHVTQRRLTAVAFIGDRSPTVLGGAFNTEPGSSAYAAINGAGFDFAAFGLGGPSPYVQATQPGMYTNYIWLRGLTSLQGWLPRTPPTNHKRVAVRFALP
jgi:endonuclease/exonuclease/phosphatase family metal-dependent hydrolase